MTLQHVPRTVIWARGALVAGLSLLSVVAFAQGRVTPATSAQEAIQRFVTLNAKSELITPAGQMVNRVAPVPRLGEISAPDRVESPLDGYAVARVVARGPNGQPTNGYLLAYRDSQGNWAVNEARGLYRAFESMTDAAKMGFQDQWLEERHRTQAAIAVKTDRDLAQWFEGKRTELDKLRMMIKSGPYGNKGWDTPKAPRSDDYNLVLHHLPEVKSINVTRQDLLVRVFESVDEVVGFVYSPEEPPRMDPGSNIWREALGDDWYLIRKIPKCPWPSERFNCRGRR